MCIRDSILALAPALRPRRRWREGTSFALGVVPVAGVRTWHSLGLRPGGALGGPPGRCGGCPRTSRRASSRAGR
eukprot:13415495-Alexandrium_andersonii.AAC.1